MWFPEPRSVELCIVIQPGLDQGCPLHCALQATCTAHFWLRIQESRGACMQRGAIRGMAFWGAPPGLASPSADDVELALALGFEDPCSAGPLSEAGEEQGFYFSLPMRREWRP